MDSAIGFPNTYPLDSDLSSGQRHPTFRQPGLGSGLVILILDQQLYNIYAKFDETKHKGGKTILFLHNVSFVFVSYPYVKE